MPDQPTSILLHQPVSFTMQCAVSHSSSQAITSNSIMTGPIRALVVRRSLYRLFTKINDPGSFGRYGSTILLQTLDNEWGQLKLGQINRCEWPQMCIIKRDQSIASIITQIRQTPI
jgi:hypothetical protein